MICPQLVGMNLFGAEKVKNFIMLGKRKKIYNCNDYSVLVIHINGMGIGIEEGFSYTAVSYLFSFIFIFLQF